MSESDGEQVARSVALEQAYVHDVYEQYAEKTAQSRHWPRIYQFLEELEPGALVCDVGCGNGKYLSVNQSIFKVGADRCKKLTEIAREKENEVLICDNLALPFRDESFDAVLSIAVVHHFATTERRVHALKELARVLRIGGRLVISVWAMEQRHRKFESQDVLVPWPKAYCLGSSLNRTRASGIPFADEMNHNQTVQKDTPISKRASQEKCRSKSYWIDPVFSPSPSTSSLSSPNETCYSFFRRALQKLAGGKRGPGSRPWFLENWHSGAGKERRYIEHEDSEDIDDLPIELRRLEDINVTINKFPDTLSIKSKSLGDIIEIQRHDLVRSRSSIPGLCSTLISDTLSDEQFKTSPLNTSKPRLVKQKSHFIDDICLEIPENTAIQEIIKDLPDFQVPTQFPTKRANVHKQNSMNEELMSMERLQERERVRQNIMKQASLNEEIMCKRKTFEALKDSIYSGNATKRFQLLKSGLTNKIKQSTTNIEKVSGMSIKNGFVRILQGWKSGETEISTASTVNCELVSSKIKLVDKVATTVIKRDVDSIERRLSREDGSDSSKDSSLQSDTSVDSEDSFASVIYVPKQDVSPLVEVISAPPRYQLNATSAPPSPHVKHPPDFSGSRLKLVPISPLLKQFPATSKSLPPPSPPRLSPRTFTSFPSRPLFGPFPSSQQMSIFDKLISGNEPESTSSKTNDVVDSQSPKLKDKVDEREKTNVKEQKFSLKTRTVDDDNYSDSKAIISDEAELTDDTASLIPALEDALTSAQEKIAETFLMESINEEESRKARLNQIKELLKQKPGFATRCAKPSFPLVRRASTAAPGRLEAVMRPLPRLLSLDLFNPETDDADSDSSVVSSPESVGSVISVISDERFVVKKENLQSDKNGTNAPQSEESKTVVRNSSNSETTQADDIKYDLLAEQNPNGTSADAPLASPHSLRLLEAAANVASSLEDAVETAIQLKAPNNSHATRSEERVNADKASTFVNPWKTRASSIDLKNAGDFKKTTKCSLPEEKNWNEECRQHLIDFTEKLSENLIHDIDQYCQKTELELSKDFDGKSEDFFGSDAKSGVTANANDAPSTSPRYDDAPSRGAIESCKYSELVNTIARLSNKSTDEEDNSENDNKPSDRLLGLECSNADVSSENVINNVCMHRSSSENIMDFVLVSNNGEFINEGENDTRESSDKQRLVETTILRAEDADPNEVTSTDVTEKPYLRFTNSIESSDIGDSIENTISVSDSSQTESFQESIMAEQFRNDSTASLESTNIMCDDANDKRKVHNRTRSASEELPSRMSAPKQQASINSECLVTTATSNGTLSASSSQESLPSDHGGGSITYPQYYHVFREGELDQLINKYVENLHIISSYYDHASWCIVAEKVQVWTI